MTEALEVARGTLVVAVEVAADTGVVGDTHQEVVVAAATEKIGGRVDMANALDPTVKHMTAMLQTSKRLPDSRSSLGWLYFKDALLKKNVHVLLLTLVL